MAITVLIKLIPGTFPEGFCPATLQEEWNKGIGLAQATLQVDVGNSFFNFGDTTPTPENRVFPWLRTIGGRIDRWYVYSNGFWLSPYQGPEASSDVRWGWVGIEADLATFEGGEVGVVDDYHGPFWVVDHDFDGRSPMGPGVIPNSTPAKTLSVAEDFGEGSHLQTAQEVGTHSHTVVPSQIVASPASGPDSGILYGGTGDILTPLTVGANPYTTTQLAMPVVHPVRALFQIKRTSRIFLRI